MSPQGLITLTIRYAQIEPTTRCNFTCGFCVGRSMSQGDLSLESFSKILELHPDLEHIELQGEGEPTLNRDFVKMLALAHQKKLKILQKKLLNEVVRGQIYLK